MVGIKVPARHNVSAPPANNPRLFYFGTILRGEKAEKMMSLGSAASLRQINGLSKEDDANQPPIPGVRLGPLLGRGSFGSVHYGTWNGAQIAVKVGKRVKKGILMSASRLLNLPAEAAFFSRRFVM